jgi:glutamate--cysteine ligase
MTPDLITPVNSEFFKLEKLIINKSIEIEQWFRACWREIDAPFYGSVDLRNSGFKISPVDTNLFPAGFNNLNPQFEPLAIQAISVAIENICPEASKLIIIPENHTRNIFYLKNIFFLSKILSNAGLEVELASLDNKEISIIDINEENPLVIYPLEKKDNKIYINKNDKEFRPCAILLNNDLSSGKPEILENIEQHVVPNILAGWFNRRKSNHFEIYNNIANKFSEFLSIDPWLINPFFESISGIDINNSQDQNKIKIIVDNLIEKIKVKYNEYKITHEPYVVIKADSGTYGMGIITVKNGSEIEELNRKKRNKLSTIKDGQLVKNLIIQEGIHTEELINNAVSEPVVYTIDKFVIGGFYRVHTSKEKDENLNSPGMHFLPIPFETSCLMPDQGRNPNDIPNRFYVYGVIARLAILAAAKECDS